MTYSVIGLMSGSSLDGLDIAFIELTEQTGKWSYKILFAETLKYSIDWREKLMNATKLNARNYQLLHIEYGHYLGSQINSFINKYNLHYKVALISSHGHTVFHEPSMKMTAQIGDGASIAAETCLPVVTDLRSLDIAFGGQGAPIVPIGEKLLFSSDYLFLNIGGIANISFNTNSRYIAYDVCPANSILNKLAFDLGYEYDKDGENASRGYINNELLDVLNQVPYYKSSFPKSLGNEFGAEIIFPLIVASRCSIPDSLRTYSEHIAAQVYNNILLFKEISENKTLMITGGGAHNTFLIKLIQNKLAFLNVHVAIPDALTINFKEALIMAFIGVLRWRQEYNVLSDVTGALRNSIGGAVWIGQEA